MITQAMILAAGKGTRMRPLTLTTPKPLVTVVDKPLIVWHIERLRSAGITNIAINVGHLGGVITDTLNKMDLGVNLRISDENVFIEPLETAGGIKYALDNGCLHDEPFVLVNGDVWTEYDFTNLVGVKLGEYMGHLVLTANPDHHQEGDFSLDGDKVVIKSESLPNYTFAGLSVLSPKLVDSVIAGEIAPLATFLKNAISKGCITGELMQDKWVDVGTIERLTYVNNYIKQKYSL